MVARKFTELRISNITDMLYAGYANIIYIANLYRIVYMSFMPSDKPKIIIAMEEDLLKRIDDYRFENRINSRSEAIRRLIEEGLKKCSAEYPQKKNQP